jgi:N-(2-amino-2-carboxyethyl)-L-glutamate synthase
VVTPLVTVRVVIAGRMRQLRLKLEGANPSGSIKYRTAQGLLGWLGERGALVRGATLIESTSGNLGVALAMLARERGIPFIAIIDPNTTREFQTRMREFDADLHMVAVPDAFGGFLASRLQTVADLLAADPSYVWPNQYENWANPSIHFDETAPELDAQLPRTVQAVLVAVSTGGTLAGVARYFQQSRPHVRMVAVDISGSVVLGGQPRPRRISGIGSSRTSAFLTADQIDGGLAVQEYEAVRACRQIAAETGVHLGASGGAVVAASLRLMSRNLDLLDVACVCADFGESYASTVYNDAWADMLTYTSSVAERTKIGFDGTMGDESGAGRLHLV